ncbi:MAG TPA: cytochrome b/b6 domain-containing protein [Candidatus Aphodousia faecipullorum]|nr:cytochrome b/b6 domain-containing protein [Candidatus Aphodousia faecipullorum]
MKVYRQTLRNRLVHWGIAFSCFGLIVTGILQMPVAKRYGVTAVFPSTADFFTTLPWHYAFAIIFTFLCVFHLAVNAFEGSYDIVPQKGDFSKSIQIVKALLTGQDEPASGKYLPEQRLAWAGFVLTFALLIVTGLLKTLKNFAGIEFPDPMLFWLAQLHNLGMVLTVLLFLGHMAAFLFKANRFLLPAMFSGYVDADYARRRHSLWFD